MNLPASAPFLFYPLLLERSYGGGGEALWLLLQGLFWLVGMAVVGIAVAKLSTRAAEVYGELFSSFMKGVGLVIALFIVVYALTSIGSR